MHRKNATETLWFSTSSSQDTTQTPTIMPQTSEQILQQEYLLARAKILELAATLDRIDRAQGSVQTHPQMQLLQQGFKILIDESQPDSRAEQVQLLFSRQYAEDWRKTFGV